MRRESLQVVMTPSDIERAVKRWLLRDGPVQSVQVKVTPECPLMSGKYRFGPMRIGPRNAESPHISR